MDTSAASQLGQQLNEFLIQQFSAPPGATDTLGFLGTGVAVEPDSLQNNGQFNPARVNAWLDIVVDPLGIVFQGDNGVQSASWTATQLMEAIANQAMSLAAADSDEQQAFMHAKSAAREALGGAMVTKTAPLDWYDPANLAQWPSTKLQTSASTSSGSQTSASQEPPGPLIRKPLWAWRNLQQVPINEVPVHPPADIEPGETLTVPHFLAPLRTQAFAATMAPRAFAAVAQAPVQATFSQPLVARTFGADELAHVIVAQQPAELVSMQVARSFSTRQALLVSQAMSTAAQEASTSSVATSSLSLSLSYLVVALSRAPWWSELMLTMNNWFIPGMARGALVGESDDQKTIGLPVALVLTDNVNIQANWSTEDRQAANANTHLGPWSLAGAQFSTTSDTGQVALTLPGMRAIACIYRQLPVLPPKSDPGLAQS